MTDCGQSRWNWIAFYSLQVYAFGYFNSPKVTSVIVVNLSKLGIIFTSLYVEKLQIRDNQYTKIWDALKTKS